jgi:hypothetical protein
MLDSLLPAQRILIRQVKEWSEILVDFTCFENNQRRGVGLGIDLGG